MTSHLGGPQALRALSVAFAAAFAGCSANCLRDSDCTAGRVCQRDLCVLEDAPDAAPAPAPPEPGANGGRSNGGNGGSTSSTSSGSMAGAAGNAGNAGSATVPREILDAAADGSAGTGAP